MTEYVWTKGSRIDVDAQAVGDRLAELQRDNGQRVTARMVVDAARPEDSPLHPCFEWDNVRAGELYRESQARYVLRSIKVVQERNEDGPTRTVHAFINLEEQVGDDVQRAYVPIARVMSDAELFTKACEQAARELHAFSERYAQFDQLVQIAREAEARVGSLVTHAAL